MRQDSDEKDEIKEERASVKEDQGIEQNLRIGQSKKLDFSFSQAYLEKTGKYE